MNDNFDIFELLNQFKTDNNENTYKNISDSSPTSKTNKSDEILNLLIAIKPFLNVSKKEKLDAYINIMNFKSIINLFGGD